MIDRIHLQYYLDWAESISRSHPFIDFHVHPFDVFSGDIEYQPDAMNNGIFRKGSSVYKPPKINQNDEYLNDPFKNVEDNSRAIMLASRLIYSHTGPKVFTDHLDQARIARALLLPVARSKDTATQMLDVSLRLFDQEARLYLACPFPVGIPPDKLINFYSNSKKYKKICAIKIHTNLIGLDPLTKNGKELIEMTLGAAGMLNLPVIVHGGITIGLSSPESKRFGTLDRLRKIDWNISSAPVIIAHAGCYGLTEEEITSVLPILNRLLDTCPHLMADVSALNLPALQLLMTKIDRNRLIFGSDALYFTIWKSWVRFLHALRLVSTNPDDDLIQIASLNPSRCLSYSGNSPL
jgi:hypothetical protein